MRKSLVLFLLLGLLCLPAVAQKAEVFGGYQYLHLGSNSDIGDSGQGYNGWNAAAEYNFNRFLGVEGDFSGTYATVSGVKMHVYTYTGGPVVFAKVGNLKPFAHVLLGGVQSGGSESGVSVTFNGYTTMVGGGIDAKINRVLAVRLAQFDWVYYHFGSKTIAGIEVPSFSGSNNVRISSGIVVRF